MVDRLFLPLLPGGGAAGGPGAGICPYGRGRLLRICSNNLNQYARRANETGSIYAADVDDLRTRLDSLWDGMDKLLREFANIS